MSVTNPSRRVKPAHATAARLASVQAIYQILTTDKDMIDIVPEFLAHHSGMDIDGEAMLPPDPALFTAIVRGVEERQDQLEDLIKASLPDDSPGRKLDDLMQAALLCGAYEMLAHHDIDGPIIISDYIAVTRAFYEGNEHKIVNAILDRIYKTVRS